ncbi:alcohol dehydrogenase (cytochrome c) [Panacagrimonas perspica]|uniref:Alcohol dehydrogenase (Cytochrome c) n=1 Tax=Panacagrimonas perspica TaxID=381431 RepID=A0A4R7NZT7_9GAMM|nr:PQQ-dependent methanol/ethanol family dehydrogenase [Panacagrimonas perspica]TDU26777.1 alcohol dehydrogenase (cytochrome c) [Panacagrimonas perspica]
MNQSTRGKTSSRHLPALIAGCAMLLLAGTASAAGVTDAMISNDATSTNDVLTVGLGQSGQRFSPLTTINADNIGDLVPAWTFSFGGEKQRGQETQALVYNGKMFITGSYSRLWALDVKTGKRLWAYEHRLPDGIMPCCDVVNRGAALYDNLVIFGTLDAHLVALNMDTGKVVWNETLGDYKAGYSYTAAPLIVKGKVITGVSGGEFGIVGRVDARDAKTGKLVWSRPTVEGHMGTLNGKDNGITGKLNASWPGDMWKFGGAATWLGCTYGADVNLVYCGTGNPAPWNAHLRPGDNLYSTSTLGIDADKGVIKWSYQSTPNDHWDFDGVNEFIPFDMKDSSGKVVKAGAKADRNGFFYVLDRTNGKLLNASPFVTKQTWASGVDLKTGRPIESKNNRPGDPSAAEKGESVFSAPSFLGGKNWMPMAYSAQTGYFYVPANEWGMDIWNEPITYKKGAAYLGAGFNIKPLYDDYIGALRAIDPATGKIVWEYKNDSPVWGGVMTTAGNLVFMGTPDGYFKAFNAKTGEVLWKFQTGSGVVGQPATWEQDGEQFIAIASGWGGAVPLWGGDVAKKIKDISQGGMMWVFKLHKSAAPAVAKN